MHKIIPFVLAFCLLCACKTKPINPSLAPYNSKKEDPKELMSTSPEANQILIIYYDISYPKKYLLNEIVRQKGQIVYNYRFINAMAVKFPKEKSIAEMKKVFSSVKGVLSVVDNEVMKIDSQEENNVLN